MSGLYLDKLITVSLCLNLVQFDTENVKPINYKQFDSLENALNRKGKKIQDLLNSTNVFSNDELKDISGSGREPFTRDRLNKLLERVNECEEFLNLMKKDKVWCLYKYENKYPINLLKLKNEAPPVIFGVGEQELLKSRGLAIVGSRNIYENPDAVEFVNLVGEQCAKNNIVVVSGGAKGVDTLAMEAAIQNGGSCIGFLADSLIKQSKKKSYIEAIESGRLLLISAYEPDSTRFMAWKAMNRNKLIYAMSDYGLVVDSNYKKGGTWAGAEEQLKKYNFGPLFIRNGNSMSKGNQELINLGGVPWSYNQKKNNLSSWLGENLDKFLNDRIGINQIGLFD